MNRNLHLISFASILAFVAACAAAADPAVEKRFAFGARGHLQLAVPAGWADKTESSSPPAVSFSARQGAPFIITISPVTPAPAASSAEIGKALRQEVERALASIAPFAVEKKIEVVEFKDAAGPGFYFFATDREPRPGEYKFMTRGALLVGKIAFSFTILTNPGQEQVIRDAMTMLRRATLIQQ